MGEFRNPADGQAKQQSRNPFAQDTRFEQFNPLAGQPAEAFARPAERLRLELNNLAARKIGSVEARQEFALDLSVLANSRLTEKEKCETLTQIKRLFESTGKLSETERTKLARQVAHNAAKPTHLDQGKHNTCNVASLECRLYTRSPSVPAKVVADLALGGQIITADGSVIKPLSLAADQEGRKEPVPDGQRSFASQLFQLAATNVYWNRQTTMPDGSYAGKSMIFFDQEPGSNDNTGERLIDISKNPPRKFEMKRLATDNPRLGLDELADINAQLVGKKETDFAIIRGSGSAADGIIGVDSAQSLKAALSRLKSENKFPVLLQVDASIKPFGKDGPDSNKYEPHAVTIVDFDARTGLVSVDNQWGKASDLLGESGGKARIDNKTLFDSMRSSPPLANVGKELWKNLKSIDSDDVLKASKASLSTALLWSSLSGSTANAITSGFTRAGATSLAAATESGAGRMLTRGGTALAALGVVIVANDLHKAFQLGPEHGAGKLARVGLTSVMYELGASAGTGLASSLKMTGLGKYGLILGAGITFAAAYDVSLGEGIEFMGAAAYRKLIGRR